MYKVFLDTNILAYPLDTREKRKGTACKSLIKKAVEGQCGVISTQVLQEFYITATRKMGVEPLLAKGLIGSYSHLETVTITPQLIKEAIDCQILSQISFWDALIVVAAESAKCEAVWTEDMNHGQIIRGVRIENPLVT